MPRESAPFRRAGISSDNDLAFLLESAVRPAVVLVGYARRFGPHCDRRAGPLRPRICTSDAPSGRICRRTRRRPRPSGSPSGPGWRWPGSGQGSSTSPRIRSSPGPPGGGRGVVHVSPNRSSGRGGSGDLCFFARSPALRQYVCQPSGSPGEARSDGLAARRLGPGDQLRLVWAGVHGRPPPRRDHHAHGRPTGITSSPSGAAPRTRRYWRADFRTQRRGRNPPYRRIALRREEIPVPASFDDSPIGQVVSLGAFAWIPRRSTPS